MNLGYNYIIMNDDETQMTAGEIRNIVKEAVSEGIDDKMKLLGIDTTDPIKSQQMFQTLRDIVSFRYGVKAKLWGTIIALATVATVGWLVTGFVEAIRTAINK